MIHGTAAVDAGARLAPEVEIGAYSIIGPQVEIGEGSWVGPHVVIVGPTRIGRENRIYPFCSIGEAPQDKKYGGEPTRLEIGDRNVIREYCTLNRGTAQDRAVTRLGNDNWIMAYAHVAHDCRVGDHTVFANGASLAGHVSVDDYATLGAFTAVHQHCRIGKHSFSGMGSVILKDVPPCLLVSGNPAKPHGLNSEGLRRHGIGGEGMALLRQAYRIIYRQGLTLEAARERLTALAGESAEIAAMVGFLEATKRGIVR